MAAPSRLRITLLVNNVTSWAVPYVTAFAERLRAAHDVTFTTDTTAIPNGDIAFLLSCTKIVPPEILARNTHNIVVHASALPQGKGFAPMVWQVLEGKDRIPVTLFEAVAALDAGPVYLRDELMLDGTELHGELREKLWAISERMIEEFLAQYPSVNGVPQEGSSTTYRRRTVADDELNPQQTIAAQFDRLRVINNEAYPGWFVHRGQKYLLRIEKAKE